MLPNVAFDAADLAAKDRAHLIHPWVDLGLVKDQEPLIVSAAEGAYVYNVHGQKMLDGIGGMWCVNAGYGRGEIADAMAEQARRMAYFSPFGMIGNPPAIEFATRLTQYTPGDLKHVFFTTGGSTAVDSALRFVHFFNNFHGRKEKKHIITRDYAYHGSTYLTASVSGKPADRGNMDLETGFIHHIPVPNPYRRPEGMSMEAFCDAKVKDLEDKILELGPDKVAAFIAEPLLASGGVIVPPPGYQRRTWEICRKYDVLYISDEVVTGFGRLGHIFASKEVFDIEPDIITSAKGLTSGYSPLGAMIASDRLFEPFNDGKTVFGHGYTFGGHPVSAAVALANLDIFEREGLNDHVKQMAPAFRTTLEQLYELPIVGDIRGEGFFYGIELVKDRDTKETFNDHESERLLRGFLTTALWEAGLYCRADDRGDPVVQLAPPLISGQKEFDEIYGILHRVLGEASRLL